MDFMSDLPDWPDLPDLPCFSGTMSDVLDVHQWLGQFKIAAAFTEMDDKQRIASARLLMLGTALDYIFTLTVPEHTDWSTFEKKLEERFGWQPRQLIERLSMLRQEPQDLLSFSDRFAQLTTRLACIGEPISEGMKCHPYLNALHEPLRAAVVLSRPSSLSDAIDTAKFVEQKQFTSEMPCGKRAFQDHSQGANWHHNDRHSHQLGRQVPD